MTEGVRPKKKERKEGRHENSCMHLIFFLIVSKQKENKWMELGTVTVRDACRSFWTLQGPHMKRKEIKEATVTNTSHCG